MERASEPVSNKESCQLCKGREVLLETQTAGVCTRAVFSPVPL